MALKTDLDVHRRVRIALSVLPPDQREAVSRVLRSPRIFTAHAADSARIQEIEAPGPPLYMMEVTPQLRLIYTKTGDAIQVLDLVERATMDHLSARKVRKTVATTKGGESGSTELETKSGKRVGRAEK